MNDTKGRIALYGIAAAALAGLGVWAANAQSEADTMTLLNGVDVQLRLAWGMPAHDKQGQELTARSLMIEKAIADLEVVERQEPGMAVTAEFRGFAHMLRGEYAAAADCYYRARECEDCGGEQFDVLAFNEARMRAKAGDGAGALAVFGRHHAELDARFGHQRELEEAGILRELGRVDEAFERLGGVLADDAVEPMARVQAGLEYERLGAFDRAEATLAGTREEAPVADYHLARLKLRAGDVDTALDCLERAAAAVPAAVRGMLREDADLWQPLAGNARFQQCNVPAAATPGR